MMSKWLFRRTASPSKVGRKDEAAHRCRKRRRDTPIWKLEAALKCRSCRKGRHAPPVHMIKLTPKREITPYAWVHPD
jgi:hypothetical protein